MGRPKGVKNKKTVAKKEAPAEKKTIKNIADLKRTADGKFVSTKVLAVSDVPKLLQDEIISAYLQNNPVISEEEKTAIISEYLEKNPVKQLTEANITDAVNKGIDDYLKKLDSENKMVVQINDNSIKLLNSKLDAINKKYGVFEFDLAVLEKIVSEGIETVLKNV